MTSIKRTVSILLSVMMVFGMFTSLPFAASAETAVSYQEASWNGSSVVYTAKSVTNYTAVEADTTAWSDGWYVVFRDVTINARSVVTGDVKLILCDGATLKVTGGITVKPADSLTIYAQSGDTGTLTVNNGIGGINNNSTQSVDNNGGTISIHGGVINATGSQYGGAIGAGVYGAAGTVNIYGGKITAVGGSSGGAGIGGGVGSTQNMKQDSFVNIYGGNITATGRGGGAGIGGGSKFHTTCTGAAVKILGGTVTASGQVGIGAGKNSSTHKTLELGNNANVYKSNVTVYDATTSDSLYATGATENVTDRYNPMKVVFPHNISIASNIPNGTVTANKTKVSESEEVTLTVTPESEDYILSTFTVKDANNNDVTVTNNKFKMPSSDVSISAAFTRKKFNSVSLSVIGNGGTASLMKSSYEALKSTDTIKEGEKFILCVDKNEESEFTVNLTPGGNDYIKEFTDNEYAAYIAYAKENKISVPDSTALAWITMPYTASGALTVTVDFSKLKEYTILYQTQDNPNNVWCKFMMNAETKATDLSQMISDCTLGDGTKIYSLSLMAGTAPTKVAFGTSKSAVDAVTAANMTGVSVFHTTTWTDTTNGKFCVIGGEAKTVIAAFVADASSMSVYNSSTATFSAGTGTNGAEYRIAVCPTDSEGNVTADATVTAPAAPTKTGYTFAGWRGFEGTAPNKTEKIYQPGESISVRENTTLNAVWNKANLSITLNLNGGKGGSNVTSVTYGNKLTIAQNPTKAGYSFNGWIVSENVTENGVNFAKGTPFDFNTPITANLKLTAQWKHIHSYTAYRLTQFDALSAYHKYDTVGHLAVCSCDDMALVAHEFDSKGKCACGYRKPDPTATLDVSYGQLANGIYTEKMGGIHKTVKKGLLISTTAPAKYGDLKFSKWQYTTGGAWTDLTTSAYVLFTIPCNVKLRACYIADTLTTPQVEISAQSYDQDVAYNGQNYKMANILFKMSYKLPDNCTFVAGGLRLGNNVGISYYTEKSKQTYAYHGKATFLKNVGTALNVIDDNKSVYYVEREDSVLNYINSATLAKYMYEEKPVNVPTYKPLYWNVTVKNKANNGVIATCPPVNHTQSNNGNHYIYGISWLRYKDNKGNTKTIYTDALAATLKKIPSNTLVKKGTATRSLSAVSSGASNVDLIASGDTPVAENNDVLDTIFSDNTQLNVYVDGEWSAELSDEYGCGDTATVTAPAVDGKTFSHWTADGSIISYDETLNLTMNAHTDLYAVYSDTVELPAVGVGFTSITRTSDGENISFQAIASDKNAGIIYSTTADGDDLVIGGSGVTNVPAEQLTDDSTTMPASVIDDNNCWTLQITPDNADTVYHARAYVTVDGVTTYGDVKDIKLSELQNGVTSIANVDGYFVENPLSEALKGLLGTDLHTITWNNEDGSEIDQTVVVDGDTPTHADMTKPEDILFTYDFIGWTDSNNNFYAKDTDLPVATDAETYTATFESTRKDYFAGHSITLKGDIGVYFYLRLSEEEAANTTVTFSWKNKTLENVPVELDPNGTGFYRAECPVAVAEMTCPITAVATINGDVKDETNVYSVRDYADVILSKDYEDKYTGTGSRSYENLVTLIKAMLDYGAKAQEEFDVLTDDLANAGIDYTPAEVNANDIAGSYVPMSIEKMEQSGLHYVGTSVVYLSKTSLRHYFTITDAAKFDEIKDSITFDSVKAESTEKGNFIYFELKDITAFDLNTAYTFTAGGESMDYSVMDFVKQVLTDKNTPAADKALAAATYTYNQAAAVYFANVQ